MSLNPAGTVNYNWNYSNQQREGFSLELIGTVVSLQEVQAREYNPNNNQPGRPSFWPDGNPKMNIRVGFALPDGSLKSLTFPRAGKKQVSGEKPSVHMQLFQLTNGNMMELMGKTIHIWTWPVNPNTNQSWGQGNPRLFGVEEIAGTKYELAAPLPDEFKVAELYCNDGAQGGQPIGVPPQQIQTPNVMPMQGQYYMTPQPQPQAQPMQQSYPYTQQQPAQFQPQPQVQPQVQPMQQQSAMQTMPPQQQGSTAQMPQGMDPAVAQAMQAVGATNVQPVDETGGVYDQDIPF